MKILIQCVKSACVEVEKKEISNIGRGYLLYVSFTNGDNLELIDKMIEKLLKTRLFLDENGKTNLSIFDIEGEILSISQFTLYASLKKTNRPSFINCLSFETAKDYYEYFNNELSKKISTKCGLFGADMKVKSINDGPFTILLDSNEVF